MGKESHLSQLYTHIFVQSCGSEDPTNMNKHKHSICNEYHVIQNIIFVLSVISLHTWNFVD